MCSVHAELVPTALYSSSIFGRLLCGSMNNRGNETFKIIRQIINDYADGLSGLKFQF
jgi:hypothetical protein